MYANGEAPESFVVADLFGESEVFYYSNPFMFRGVGLFPRKLGPEMPGIVFYALKNPPVGQNLTS